MGQYSCAGRNIAGEGEQSEGIFLDVQCKEMHVLHLKLGPKSFKE